MAVLGFTRNFLANLVIQIKLREHRYRLQNNKVSINWNITLENSIKRSVREYTLLILCVYFVVCAKSISTFWGETYSHEKSVSLKHISRKQQNIRRESTVECIAGETSSSHFRPQYSIYWTTLKNIKISQKDEIPPVISYCLMAMQWISSISGLSRSASRQNERQII